MPYEEFRDKGGRSRFGFSTVTLLRSGGISLNKYAFLDLGRPKALVLAYDKDAQRIGIRAGSPEDEAYSYPIRQTSEDAYWVAAQGFLRYHGIVTSVTTRYAAIWDNQYLAVDLAKEPVHRERRSARKES